MSMKSYKKYRREYIGWMIISIAIILYNIISTMVDLIYKDTYASCYIVFFLSSIFYKGTLGIGMESLYSFFADVVNIRENILINRYHDYRDNNVSIEREHRWLKAYIIIDLVITVIHALALYVLYRLYHPVSLLALIMILIINAFIITVQIAVLAEICNGWNRCISLDKIYALIISGDLTSTEDIRKAIENVET